MVAIRIGSSSSKWFECIFPSCVRLAGIWAEEEEEKESNIIWSCAVERRAESKMLQRSERGGFSFLFFFLFYYIIIDFFFPKKTLLFYFSPVRPTSGFLHSAPWYNLDTTRYTVLDFAWNKIRIFLSFSFFLFGTFDLKLNFYHWVNTRIQTNASRCRSINKNCILLLSHEF